MSIKGNIEDWSYVDIALLLIPVILYIVAAYTKYRKSVGGNTIASFGLLLPSIVLLRVDAPFALISLLSFATIITMLTVARVGAIFYTVLCLVSGGLLGLETQDPYFAAVGALVFGLMLFATNYVVQLVLDHSNECSKLFKFRKQLSISRLVELVAAFWLPAVFLVLVGIYINYHLQSELLNAVYKSEIVWRAPNEDQQGGSNLERDVNFTLNEKERLSKDTFIKQTNQNSAIATNAVNSFPGFVHDEMETLRPGDIDEGDACKDAGFRVLGAKIPLVPLCKSIIWAVEKTAQTTFNRAQANTVARAKAKADQFNADAVTAVDEVKAAGLEAIHEMFEDMRTAAKYLFFLAGIFSCVSFVLLAAGIIGAFNLVLGRLLFDSEDSFETGQSERHRALGFRLERSATLPKALKFSIHDQITLATNLGTSGGIAVDWYVGFQAMRVGSGTHMRTSIPKPFSLLFSRLMSGKYLMTRVTVSNNLPRSHQPTISSPGDLKLVLIDLKENQELIFRVADLLAFSSNARLTSVYSAHVATHLLGLGSFFAVATGPCYVVITSEGQQVCKLRKGLSVPPESLLCWDRRTEFSLGQQASFSGMWLNDPSVVGNSVGGTALIDEGRSSGPGLLRHFWRVIRYLFMPF